MVVNKSFDKGHQHEACGCGHDHSHEHTPEDHKDDGCGVGHEHQEGHMEKRETKGQIVYLLEHVDCANCAAKMEAKINELPQVRSATISFTTKQLRIDPVDEKGLLDKVQEVCSKIEEGVLVAPKTKKAAVQKESMKVPLIEIGIGAFLFLVGKLLEEQLGGFSTVVFIIAYLALGRNIVLTAVKNLAKGHVFDENFLMSVATIAAFAIGDFAEAVVVMLFYRVGEYFEHVAVEKSRGQIMDAIDMRPEVVQLAIGDDFQEIPAEEAKIGDIVLVRPGDRIPLDGVVTKGESRVDTSPVTGEPVPVKAVPGTEVISGCMNTSGVLKVRVVKVLRDSMVSRILESVENAAASKPKMDRFITKFARVYTPFVVVLALGTAIVPSLITGNWEHWIYTAITFLVISCPCALVLSVPLAFFSGIGAGSKVGILFKGGAALESLKAVKAIVMDKTGTITKGNFVVQKLMTEGSVTEEELLSLAASCERSSTHPIGNSILQFAKERKVEPVQPESVEEIPGKGIKAVINGRTVLCGNKALLELFQVDLTEYRPDGYGTEVLIAMDTAFHGYLLIADTLKEDAKEAVQSIHGQNIRTAMLTGDSEASAKAVAQEVSIEEMHAQLLPEQKLSVLSGIRDRLGAVMFVGDGINDAPVLAGADVGAAMGSGADAAIEAADVVYMTSAVKAIPQSVEIAKKTGRIAMQNVVFALIIKVLIMILGLAGYANMWMAVFADTGVTMICVLNSIRILYRKG